MIKDRVIQISTEVISFKAAGQAQQDSQLWANIHRAIRGIAPMQSYHVDRASVDRVEEGLATTLEVGDGEAGQIRVELQAAVKPPLLCLYHSICTFFT